MECDYCGLFCSGLGVNAVEAFEFNGWTPPSAIERHNALVERRLECALDQGQGEYEPSDHKGPWHDRRGRPYRECPNCKNDSAMDIGTWDASLDHDACPICVASGATPRSLITHAEGSP